MRSYITSAQAKTVLPDGDEIHTFIQSGIGLVGADWSRKEIEDRLDKGGVIELTGPSARSMQHGICVYNSDTKYLSDVLFVETDEAKLVALEEELGIVMEDDGHERVD